MASQPTAPDFYRKAYQDFTGGLATRANPLQIAANQFSQLQNAVMNDEDILQKVQGYTFDGAPFPNTPDSFIRLLLNYKIGSSVNTLVCAAQDDGNANVTYKVDLKQSSGDGNYYYFGHTVGTADVTYGSTAVTGLGTSWALHLKAGDKFGVGGLGASGPTVWYEIASVNSNTSLTLLAPYAGTTATSVSYMVRIILNKSYLPVGVVFNNNVIISNGTDAMMEYNNTTLGRIQPTVLNGVNYLPPAANFLVLHKNRVFALNWPGAPSGVAWCYANDETTWDPVSTATVFAEDNGSIVGAVSYAGSLLVFKDNGNIYQMAGEFDQNAQGSPAYIKLLDCPDNLGVIFGRTIVVSDSANADTNFFLGQAKVYFLSQTGIYAIDTRLYVTKMSWDIQPTLENLTLLSSATANKQFAFTSLAQWDTGTMNSLSGYQVTNGLSTFFNSDVMPNVRTDITNTVATCIDSSNNLYVAWVAPVASGVNQVNYAVYSALDDSVVQTEVVSSSFLVGTNSISAAHADSVSIAVSSSGTVGIMTRFYTAKTSSTGNIGANACYVMSELIGGVWENNIAWQGTETGESGANTYYDTYRSVSTGICLRYLSSTNPGAVIACGNAYTSVSSGQFIQYGGQGGGFLSRSGTTWTMTTIGGPTGGGVGSPGSEIYTAVDFAIDGSGNYYAALAASNEAVYSSWATTGYNAGAYPNTVWYAKSTNGGLNWTFPLSTSSLAVNYLVVDGNGHTTNNGAGAQIGNGSVGIGLDENNTVAIVYNFCVGTGGDVGNIVRYNVSDSTPLKSTVLSGSTISGTYYPVYLKGYYNNGTGNETYYSILPQSDGTYQENITYNINYNVGAAEFTNGSTAVVGTNTRWTLWVQAGDLIKLGTDSEDVYATVSTVNSDMSITLSAAYTGTTNATAAAYLTKRRVDVLGNVPSPGFASTLRGGNISPNQNVFAMVSVGTSANTAIVRRVTTIGTWLSPLESDNTMTQWSSFNVVDPLSSGNTILYQVGTYTSGSIPAQNEYLLSSGALVSSNNSNAYMQAEVFFYLHNFAQSSISGLLFNYIGTGVNSVLPTAIVFNNEMYLSVTEPSYTGNNMMIFQDRVGSWSTFTTGSCAMARYNQTLYIGDSQSGNIYKFRQGYDNNGSAYSMIAVTKEDILGSLELQKDIYKVYVSFVNQPVGTVTFSYRTDNFLTPGGSTWTDSTIDMTQGGLYEVTGMGGLRCSSIQFKLEQADADVQVGILGFVILYKYYNLR